MAGSKKKKNVLTLVLLAGTVVVLIGAYLLLIDHNKKEEEKAAAKAAEDDTSVTLTDFDKANIAEIDVSNENYEFTLVQEDEIWYLKGEEAFPIDQSVAGIFASTAAGLKANQIVAEDATDLSQYGLDAPSVQVHVTLIDGTEKSFAFGDKLATGNNYYGKIDDENTVYVLSTANRSSYNKGREDLMEKDTVPSITAELVTGIKVESDSYNNFTLLYDEKNSGDYSANQMFPWCIKGYYNGEVSADSSAVSDFLSGYTAITFSKAVDYKEENLENYGLKYPAAALTIWYKEEEEGEEKELTLYLGNQDEDGNYYARLGDSNRTCLLSSSTVKDLFDVDVFSLTSKSTNIINIDGVSEIVATVEGKDYNYTIEHEETTGTDGAEVTEKFYVDGRLYEDDSAFRSFYQSLIGLTVDDFLTEKVEISEKPVLTLDFKFTEDAITSNNYSIHNFVAEYLPYDEDNYAVRINGVINFTTSKDKVDTVIQEVKDF